MLMGDRGAGGRTGGRLCCVDPMRPSFLIFFAVVFTAYFAIQAYLFIRGWQAVRWFPRWRWAYAGAFWFLALAFVAGRMLENVAVTPWSTALIWAGAFWFAMMYYLFLGTLVLDFGGRFLRRKRWLPRSWLVHWGQTKFLAAVSLVSVVAIVVAWGHWNARNPEIVRASVSLPRMPGAPESLRVAVASDLHLGTLVTQERVRGWVEMINELEPDLIILPGDIIDEDLPPVVEHNLGEPLRSLRARFGVYAVTGNHEYIGGVDEAVSYLENHGITVLRDRAVPVAGGAFWLAGREDANSVRFGGRPRVALADILLSVPRGAPLVVADHQPVAAGEAAAAGAHLQLSGHTHDGQLWPNKYILMAMHGFSSGIGILDGMPLVVSPGLGTWGPPVRVGNRPQILDLTLQFERPPPENF